MIAADTSSMVAYFSGEQGNDVDAIDQALLSNQLYLSPFVLSELLSDPKLPSNFVQFLLKIALLEISETYWEKSGKTRATLLGKKLKARMSDAFIAQSCLDHDVALITRDNDFRHFENHCGLKLLKP